MFLFVSLNNAKNGIYLENEKIDNKLRINLECVMEVNSQ